MWIFEEVCFSKIRPMRGIENIVNRFVFPLRLVPLLFIGKMDQTDFCPFVNNFITEKLKGADFLVLKCKISVQPFSLKSKDLSRF